MLISMQAAAEAATLQAQWLRQTGAWIPIGADAATAEKILTQLEWAE
ncbi:hypothetical protein ACFVZH_39045 [Streptomyces sp. NPDC059534]